MNPSNLVEYLTPATLTPVTEIDAATYKAGGSRIDNLPSVWKLDGSIEWLIPDMMPLGGVTLLTAASGTGKTWLAYAIGGAVASGSAFLGREVKQRRVVYLDGENPATIVKRNLKELGIEETEMFKIWGGWCPDRPLGPGEAEIVEYAKLHKPLFIWDSLVEFHDGDEQLAKETRAFMKRFRVLANAGATVLVLHHTGKSDGSQEYRGSSDIKAVVDMAYKVEGNEKNRIIHRLTMTNFKSRFAPGQDFAMQFYAGRGFEALELPQRAQKASAESVVASIIAEQPGLNKAKITKLAMKAGIAKHPAEEVLNSRRCEPGKGREKVYYPQEGDESLIPKSQRLESGNTEIHLLSPSPGHTR